jgi:O-antigen ligase
MLNFNIMDYVMGAAIFLTLIEIGNKQWRFKDGPQNWLVLGFFVAVAVSNLFDFQLPFYIAGTMFALKGFGKVILLYFLISINLRTIRQVKGFIAAIIIGTLFIAVHGILQIHTGAGFGGQAPLYIPQENAYRTIAFGFFNDPNDVAQALVVVLPFLINGIHRPGITAPRRLLNLFLAGVVGYAVYLTGSRGGWLALAVVMISYFLLNFRQKKLSIVLAGLALVGLLGVAPSRVSSGGVHDASARGRIVAWGDGIHMLKSSPIFGVGMGRFSEYASTIQVAHNSFVQCWAEVGLFGYFWWLGILYASVKDSYRLGKDRPEDPEKDPEREETARIARILLCAFIGYLTASIFLTRTYKSELFILVAVIAAMHAMRVREGAPQPLPPLFVRHDCRRVLAIELTSIPFLWVMMRFLW